MGETFYKVIAKILEVAWTIALILLPIALIMWMVSWIMVIVGGM